MTSLGATFTLQGKKATINGQPVSSFKKLPDENITLFKLGTMGSFFLGVPEDSFMVYLHATEAGRKVYRDAIMAGTAKMGVFQRASRAMMWSRTQGPLQTVFKNAPKDVVAILEVVASDEPGFEGKLIINYMVVRPAWRRNGILLKMMRNLRDRWPDRKFKFDSPTEQGEAFTRAVAAMGYPVADDQEYPHSKKRR